MRYTALTNGTLIKSESFERRMGKPKSDIERVMTHYNVSEVKARKMLKEKSVDDLLPKRGQRAIAKSTVRTHQRRTKTGKVVNINQYQNIKTKKQTSEEEHIRGLKKWVNEYNDTVRYSKADPSNSYLKKEIFRMKHVIDAQIKKHKINPSDVGWKLDKSLSKSLEFPITGKDLIAGIKTKIAELEKQYKILEDANKVTDSGDNMTWRKNNIRRFKKVLAKIESGKNYSLTTYEMEEYGLLKSISADLRKSLEFDIIGQRIREGVMMMIGELKAKLSILKEKQKQGVAVKSDDDISEISTDEAVGIKCNPVVNDWEIKSCERKIEQLERIVRNIDPKKKFKLDTYELEKYGL